MLIFCLPAYAGIRLNTVPSTTLETPTSNIETSCQNKPTDQISEDNKVDYEVELKSEDLAADIKEAMTDNVCKEVNPNQTPDDNNDFHELEDSLSGLQVSSPDDRSCDVGEEDTDGGTKGHKYTSSIDSGYQGSTKGGLQTRTDICSGESSADESMAPSTSTSPISENRSKVFDPTNQAQASDGKNDNSGEGCVINSSIVKENLKTEKPNLNLDLTASHRRSHASTLARSPSSPAINSLHQKLQIKERLKIQSPVSPSSPYLGTDGILNATTPTYAKIRHFAQSPVQHFKHFPISRNPYMSPYLADPELLMDLCPIYFVVSDHLLFLCLLLVINRAITLFKSS